MSMAIFNSYVAVYQRVSDAMISQVLAMVYLGDKLGLYKQMASRGSTWTASRWGWNFSLK